MSEFTILEGDVLERLAELPEGSFDACLTDPPYGLSEKRNMRRMSPCKSSREKAGGFMGMKWDSDVPGPEVWAEVLRVLKPGAMLLAFGGTRTHHRLWCAIEDAGFEVRDCLMWLYGSGFPKSANISKNIDKAAGEEREIIGRRTDRAATPKRDIRGGRYVGASENIDLSAITAPATEAAKQWDGWGSSLKPAYEPICLAMKPVDGTFANNALKHGVAGLNVDGCRVGLNGETPCGSGDRRGGNIYAQDEWTRNKMVNGGNATPPTGRWPANIIHDGSEEVVRGFPETKGQQGAVTGDEPSSKTNAIYGDFNGRPATTPRGDSGSAARFFYVPKADATERRIGGVTNNHPTVKPVDLCAYLAKLILPPERDSPRRILVPYSGSGSEVMGALRAGWNQAVGIDDNPKYVAMSRERILGDSPMFNREIPTF